VDIYPIVISRYHFLLNNKNHITQDNMKHTEQAPITRNEVIILFLLVLALIIVSLYTTIIPYFREDLNQRRIILEADDFVEEMKKIT
jgi:hypothetical protein